MVKIFNNFKRFEVSRKLGKICQNDDLKACIEDIVKKLIKGGLGKINNLSITLLLPENIIIPVKKI